MGLVMGDGAVVVVFMAWSAHVGIQWASSPIHVVSHRFDHHLSDLKIPTHRHAQKQPLGCAWGAFREHEGATRYEYIPTPDMHLLRPSARVVATIRSAFNQVIEQPRL
jgi:hypothetical protein